ncbi:hypothetical protein [uncultured Legionella sp.]|uniref:hypothetical protein n=1 Tax=uncultured Legionella sp. TaxID=210934 RepID=UPI00262DE023|nr:hypothetical protein [uncultured Legionella sp.]
MTFPQKIHYPNNINTNEQAGSNKKKSTTYKVCKLFAKTHNTLNGTDLSAG